MEFYERQDFNQFRKDYEYKTFCTNFSDEIKYIKEYLKDSTGMTIKEIENKIKEDDLYPYNFLTYKYFYNGKQYTATLHGTINKILKVLEYGDIVFHSADDRWILKENLTFQSESKATFNNRLKYKQLENAGFIHKIVSDEQIDMHCGERPKLQNVGLPENAKRISQEELEKAKRKLDAHAITKPLIWGRTQWNEEESNLRLNYNRLKNQYNSTIEQFKRYDKLVEEYEGKVVEYVLNIVDDLNQEMQKKKDYWYNLSAFDFEKKVAGLFEQMGYNANVTRATGDGGVDIVLEKDTVKIAVQCKAHKDLVGPNIIRELAGVVVRDSYSMGIVVGLAGFTTGAKDEAKKLHILLLDINNLIKMFKKSESTKCRVIEAENKNEEKVINNNDGIKVKYNLDNLIWKKVQSSNVNFIAYDKEYKLLFVEFKKGNNTYCYCDVNGEDYSSLLNADSKGSYLRNFIIPRYKCVDSDNVYIVKKA